MTIPPILVVLLAIVAFYIFLSIYLLFRALGGYLFHRESSRISDHSPVIG